MVLPKRAEVAIGGAFVPEKPIKDKKLILTFVILMLELSKVIHLP